MDTDEWDKQEETVKDDTDGQAEESKEKNDQAEPEIAQVEVEDAPGVEEVPESQEQENGAEHNKYSSPYYLMKNEPKDYSIDDLENEPDQTSCWGAAYIMRSTVCCPLHPKWIKTFFPTALNFLANHVYASCSNINNLGRPSRGRAC
jgi:hypothetical protein